MLSAWGKRSYGGPELAPGRTEPMQAIPQPHALLIGGRQWKRSWGHFFFNLGCTLEGLRGQMGKNADLKLQT